MSENARGFGLGMASSTARPATMDNPRGTSGYNSVDEDDALGASGGALGSSGGGLGGSNSNQLGGGEGGGGSLDGTLGGAVPADKNRAFALFKDTVAPDLKDELARLNAVVRGHKEEVRAKTAAVNKSTEDIRRFVGVVVVVVVVVAAAAAAAA